MAMVQDDLDPAQPPPLNPLNVDPLVGAAVRDTVMPVAKSAAHVPGQEIPLGLLVTMPVPFPPRVTVSRSVETGTVKRAVTVAIPETDCAHAVVAPGNQPSSHATNREASPCCAWGDLTVNDKFTATVLSFVSEPQAARTAVNMSPHVKRRPMLLCSV